MEGAGHAGGGQRGAGLGRRGVWRRGGGEGLAVAGEKPHATAVRDGQRPGRASGLCARSATVGNHTDARLRAPVAFYCDCAARCACTARVPSGQCGRPCSAGVFATVFATVSAPTVGPGHHRWPPLLPARPPRPDAPGQRSYTPTRHSQPAAPFPSAHGQASLARSPAPNHPTTPVLSDGPREPPCGMAWQDILIIQ